MSWLSKVWHKVTRPVTGLLKTVVGGLLGGGASRAPEIKVTNPAPAPALAPAPAVAAPEPIVGQESTDLVSKKKRVGTKGKRSLMIDTGGSSSSGGSTGTGLNL